MQNTQHQNLVGFIWNIANKLRGPDGETKIQCGLGVVEDVGLALALAMHIETESA